MPHATTKPPSHHDRQSESNMTLNQDLSNIPLSLFLAFFFFSGSSGFLPAPSILFFHFPFFKIFFPLSTIFYSFYFLKSTTNHGILSYRYDS